MTRGEIAEAARNIRQSRGTMVCSLAATYIEAALALEDQRLKPALSALRTLAVVDRHRPGVQAVDVIGKRCRVCFGEWPLDAPEDHMRECPLFGDKK